VAVNHHDRQNYKCRKHFSDNFARVLKFVGLCIEILHGIPPASMHSRRPSIHIDLNQKSLAGAERAANFIGYLTEPERGEVRTACGFVAL
jgi:hypothetical protein